MHISDWSSDVCSSDLIGLAHRQQFPRVGPAAEGIVRIEARAAAIAALRIQHHAIGDERIALPFIPEPRAAARDIRSEERSVGKACVSTVRSRCSPWHSNKTKRTK